jgi:hypothetical protein
MTYFHHTLKDSPPALNEAFQGIGRTKPTESSYAADDSIAYTPSYG